MRRDDFDEELRAHLEMLAEENVRRGMTPEEAEYAARRSLGNLTQIKETRREGTGLTAFETLWADIRYGARTLRANTGFTLVTVATLALGIGTLTSVFTVYDAVALKPLPVGDPDQVVRLERWFESHARGDVQYVFSYPEYVYLSSHAQSFSALAAASWLAPAITNEGERLLGQFVSANYFAALEVPAEIGRTFLSDDAPVIVLSHAFWQRRFQGDPQVLGRVMRLNGVPCTIVGVAPRRFTGASVLPQIPDFWQPVLSPDQRGPFQIVARRRPAVNLAAAEAETSNLMRQYASTANEMDHTIRVALQRTALFGNTEDPRFQASFAMVMAIVGLVLLIGCVNVANMMLARGAARQKEIGVRLALGASRERVIRQLLTESALLGLVSGAAGLLLSTWICRMLGIAVEQFLTQRLGTDVAFAIDLNPDARVTTCALVLALVSVMMFGLSPALRLSRPDVVGALKRETGGAPLRLRGVLIAGQVAASMTLLILAGLLLRGLSRAGDADAGFDTHHVYAIRTDDTSRQNLLLDRLRSAPGIVNATTGTVPLVGTWTPPMIAGSERARVLASYASEAYFDTLGISLLHGRAFTALDRGANVAVISEAAARRFWPQQDPLGRQFQLDLDFRGTLTAFQVVGVAKDARFSSLSRIDDAHVYLAQGARAFNEAILVRSQIPPSAIRAIAFRIDPNLAAGITIMNLESGPVELQRSLARLSAMFATILAALAVALAGVGIYGVMGYLVSQRTREIGIRVALGARAFDVVSAVVIRGLRPVFWGLAAGVAAAAAIAVSLHATLTIPGAPDVLFGASFYDPPTFLGLSLFLLVVAFVASAIPARTALKVDPLTALRYE